jgi:hypothetical protein
MVLYIYNLIKRMFNIPDISTISNYLTQAVVKEFKYLEKKLFYCFFILLLVHILEFISILLCLEYGFHWTYLVKF